MFAESGGDIMQLVVGFCRYALPLLAFIILFKCMLTLLIGHPINKTYGYIVSSINGEKIPLNTWETSIGRSKSCDIILLYGTVSRFHAAICRRVDGWYIFDTNSKLGTFVNGEKIDGQATIKNSDILTFGDCNFRFVITDDPVIEVGRKRRKKKQQPQNENTASNEAPAFSYEEPNIKPESSFSPQSNERYDDFDSIHIDFHPKAHGSENEYRGNISDVYSGAGNNNSSAAYRPATESVRHKKQAAIVNPATGETFLLCANSISIGRSRSCDIKLDGRSVSRNHALLTKKNGRWYISDSGSTYGTFIGGNKISKSTALFNGDIIALSDVKLKFIDDYR